MEPRGLKVGELARRTEISIRTLHHYDEIGLLRPSQRTASGHRLYTDQDVARLQQIVSLRDLGLSLDEIAGALEGGALTLAKTLALHRARLQDRTARIQQVVHRLDSIIDTLSSREHVALDDLLDAIQEITMFDKYFTPEQQEQLKQRGQGHGPEQMAKYQQEWQELIAKVRAEMDLGTDSADPKVQALATRWRELLDAFTVGDMDMMKRLGAAYAENPKAAGDKGLDPKLFEYVGRAWKAKRSSPLAAKMWR